MPWIAGCPAARAVADAEQQILLIPGSDRLHDAGAGVVVARGAVRARD